MPSIPLHTRVLFHKDWLQEAQAWRPAQKDGPVALGLELPPLGYEADHAGDKSIDKVSVWSRQRGVLSSTTLINTDARTIRAYMSLGLGLLLDPLQDVVTHIRAGIPPRSTTFTRPLSILALQGGVLLTTKNPAYTIGVDLVNGLSPQEAVEASCSAVVDARLTAHQTLAFIGHAQAIIRELLDQDRLINTTVLQAYGLPLDKETYMLTHRPDRT